MPQISCPHCGQTFDLTDEQAPQYAGRTITCTACQKAFTVPGMPVNAPTIAYQTYQTGVSPGPGKMAICSFILGLIGIFIPLVGLVGVGLGIAALVKSRDPRVGGKGLAIAGIAVGAVGTLVSVCFFSMFLGIMLPSLGRARETANRVKCASNMRQIGQALLLYANDNRGQYPPRLEDLLLTQSITSEVFVCPSSNDSSAPGATPQAQAAALSSGGHESYIYIPNLNSSVSAETVVLYEPLNNHSNAGMNVLFGDGHVEFLPKIAAAGIVAEIHAGFNPPRRGHY